MKERSHTEIIDKLSHRYTINVSGADHPIVNSLRIISGNTDLSLTPGYLEAPDAGAEKFVHRWVTYGTNFAFGKPYTFSVPSTTQWDSGDPNGKKLTDGVAGPPYPGGIASRFAACWNKGQNPDITVDLGRVEKCGAFRIQLGAGWPWWDALKGEVKDTVEVLTSTDNENFQSQGFFNLNLRRKDIPANHFLPDEETLCAHLFEMIPQSPANARYVRYRVNPARTLTVSEVEVLDFIRYEPIDLRLTLPDERLTLQ